MKPNKIGGNTYTDQVIKEIERMIKENNLKPGDRLPSESELANYFSVSKSVVREAMRVLKTSGLIQSKPGIGAIICNPPSSIIITPLLSMLLLNDLNFMDVFALRRGLEVEAASLAAQSATAEDLANLKKSNEALLTAVQKGAIGVDEDFEFHKILFLSTSNAIFIKLFNSISSVLKEGIKQSKLKSVEIPGRSMEGVEEHAAIIQAIELKDSRKARQSMRKHLQNNEWRTWNLESHWE